MSLELERLGAIIKARTSGHWGLDWHRDPKGRELWRPLGPISATKEQAMRDAVFMDTCSTLADLMLDVAKAGEALNDKLRDLDVAMANREGSFLIRSASTPASYWERVVEGYQSHKGALAALKSALSQLPDAGGGGE